MVDSAEMSPFLTRVVLRNYKSISDCSVDLGKLTFLVGPNGAGKSNFLDALRFVSEALRTSLRNALRMRGGLKEVRRRSGGHPTHFGLRLEFQLPGDQTGYYAFEIGARPKGAYEIEREECLVAAGGIRSDFLVRRGEVSSLTVDRPPAGFADRLYLVNVSGIAPFNQVYDTLSNMGFCNLNPDAIRELQPPDGGELLNRDGSNIAGCMARMSKYQPDVKERIEEYLARIVPGLVGVESKAVGPKETVEFRQKVEGARQPWRFFAASMSDGTLRALGVLVGLFQGRSSSLPSVIGIEEPEAALHPAAAGVLLDALREASESCQVLVTSHSPDLLDSEEISDEEIMAVVSEENSTLIGGIDEASRTTLRDRLYTAGELLRLNQLTPAESLFGEKGTQLSLFGE